MREKVFHNGKLIERSEAKTDLEDRGYQFADGVYEVIAIWGGQPFKLREHMNRLKSSASGIDIDIPSVEWFMEKAENYLEEVNCLGVNENSKLYVQVTRGINSRNHAYPNGMDPEIFMKVSSLEANPTEYYENGVRVILHPDERWSRCNIKSIALLPNIMAKKTARNSGAYEAILERDGFITEGTSSNVFIVEDGKLITPPATNYILNGITRRTVIEIADELGIPLSEESIRKSRLYAADEVFITGTTTEVMPVVQVGQKQIKDGEPGVVTLELQNEYFEMSRMH